MNHGQTALKRAANDKQANTQEREKTVKRESEDRVRERSEMKERKGERQTDRKERVKR